MPAKDRHQAADCSGSSQAENGTGRLPCLRRLNRSSSAAATTVPSTTSAADGSWKTALIPSTRMRRWYPSLSRLTGGNRGYVQVMPIPEDKHPLIATLKKVAFHLKEAQVPFALAGSFAVYARGGAPCDHDVDFLIKESDAGQALAVLAEAGFRTEVPPEGWLVKVYEEDRLVDLIYSPVQ